MEDPFLSFRTSNGKKGTFIGSFCCPSICLSVYITVRQDHFSPLRVSKIHAFRSMKSKNSPSMLYAKNDCKEMSFFVNLRHSRFTTYI